MFVERFMSWSVTAGADQRVEAICRLADTYLNDAIVADDRRATEQVFTLYLNDPSAKVRTAMADALAKSERTPRTLVWGLSQDTSQVASRVYANSPLFKDADLVHAINSEDQLIQTAIAQREVLSGSVVRALVSFGGDRAVSALMQNPFVVLSPALKHDIAARLGKVPAIRAALLEAEDLMSTTRQLLVQRLSSSLVSLVSDREWGSSVRIANCANDATNRVAVEIAMDTHNDNMDEYVAHLRDTAQLTPALLVRAICAGNAALFEMAIATLSGSSLKRVQSIVDEGRISAFRALYGRTGLPQSAYGVFCAAITSWQAAQDGDNVLMNIIERAEKDETVDGALLALLGRMATEAEYQAAQAYDRQLLLAAA
ncbi:MAG: DUF2336 domain-containing protein [Rhizobiaceae bacterium]